MAIGISRKRAVHLVALLWKMICDLGDPMSLGHPVQSIALGVSFNLNFLSQSPWSFFNVTWQKRPRELDQ